MTELLRGRDKRESTGYRPVLSQVLTGSETGSRQAKLTKTA